jgi:hypothetical protein
MPGMSRAVRDDSCQKVKTTVFLAQLTDKISGYEKMTAYFDKKARAGKE